MVNNSILNEQFGPVFIGARRDSRGPWKSGYNIPEHLRWFLNLQKHGHRWFLFDFAGLSVVDIRRLPSITKWQKPDVRGWTFLTSVPALAPAPKPREISRSIPAIRNLKDLQSDANAGAAIRILVDSAIKRSVLVCSEVTEQWIHNGDKQW